MKRQPVDGDLYANTDYGIKEILYVIPFDTSGGDCYPKMLPNVAVEEYSSCKAGDPNGVAMALKKQLRILESPIGKKPHTPKLCAKNFEQQQQPGTCVGLYPFKNAPVPDIPRTLFFEHLTHEERQELTLLQAYERDQMVFSRFGTIRGFEFLRPPDKDSGSARTTRALDGTPVRISSRWKVYFHVLEWPSAVCESFSEKTVSPTELKFSAVLMAENLETGERFRVVPEHDLDVRAMLIGSSNDCDYEEHVADTNTAWDNQSASPLDIVTSDYTIKGLRTLTNHPVFPSQKSLIRIEKRIEKKYPHNPNMNTKLKFMSESEYRTSRMSSETGAVQFSELNISVPDKLPMTSKNYPNLRRKVFWDYCYHLIFRAEISLPWLDGVSLCVGAVTDRIIAVHSRNTVKNREKIEYCGLLSPG